MVQSDSLDVDRPIAARKIKPAVAEQFSRPPLARMMQLHAQLQARKFPNCRKLADELEVSSKTIQRDIEFMRYSARVADRIRPAAFRFRLHGTGHQFPEYSGTEGEIVALFVAQKALEQYRGTPFEAPLRAAFHKIGHGLKDKITFSWSDLDAAISFRSAGQSKADLEVFELLSHAVLDSVESRVRYRKLRSTGAETPPGSALSSRLCR